MWMDPGTYPIMIALLLSTKFQETSLQTDFRSWRPSVGGFVLDSLSLSWQFFWQENEETAN